ncbi:DUF4097 family beta strand repeat-containing protein [Actinoplanes sp. L3-i22]|uniref:DUF4097 family beta strand repeat-containing protein n=1 Tax=Actinoplanes sp. L3-i22 TaxID=2836373 RepID=UPI001C783265|nr:DUF4097 family beta strand repeat-containing protein [Actinoplanes sp. L3-i22]BCY15497.1 hypothetical protein L3i22_105850 [Actinoplanes sp. L3-i22]
MHKFETTAPIAAVLEIAAGRIQVLAADRSDTVVEVRPADASKSRDVKAAEETRVAFTDGVLRVEGTTTNRIFGSSGYVEVTVQLPAGSRIEAKAAAADLRGVGRLGDVTFEAAQGEIKLDEAAGVRSTTAAGDVVIGRLTGPAAITTSKGDIRIAEASRGEVVLSTQAGSISIGAATGVSAALDARTGYGQISNSLKNDGSIALDIHATTSYGDIAATSN